ncbi:MAG: polysaccharide deacetylase family protein [Candidatus Odinarchaeota archaeon]
MKIALTFDIERDIPNFLDTVFGVKIGLTKILSLLDDFQIKGTFFCTGSIVKQHPQIVKLIESKGHEIACHSLNHERLNKLNYDECKEIISKNKKLIENECQNSEIIGFRAPYLKPPNFLFKILKNLGFRYDSSIVSSKKSQFYDMKDDKIEEFHPSSFYIFFRFPLSFYFIRKWIFRKELIILYFHSWEAIDVKKLISNQKGKFSLLKNYFGRPDRCINTGDPFINRMRKFIEEALARKAQFVILKQLLA